MTKRTGGWRVAGVVLVAVIGLSITAAGYTIEQTSDTGGIAGSRVGQSFTTNGGSGAITEIGFHVGSSVENADTTLMIYEGVDGTLLYSQSITLVDYYNTVTLNTPVIVNKDSIYSFRTTAFNRFRNSNENPYAGGYTLTNYNVLTGTDLVFHVVVDESYRPDIVVSADSLLISVEGDGVGRVSGTITLRNDGNVTLSGDVPMRFSLYDNMGCAGTVVEQWTETLTAGIASGGGTQEFTIAPHDVAADLCANSTSCQMSIYIEADYSDTVGELDETNNMYCADNKSVEAPDIVVTEETLAVTSTGDGQATVSGTITLTNDGCQNCAQDVPVRFTLFGSTGCSGEEIHQWTETFPGDNLTGLGGTHTFTIADHDLSADLCANSTGCQVSIQIYADYSDTIAECSGTNNTHCADVTVDIPDVEVSDDGLVVSAHSDGIAQVSGTITLTNSGCGSTLTADVPVQFTLYDTAGCTGTVLDQWTETLTGVSIPASGGTQTITINNRKITGNMCTSSTNCQVSVYVEADYTDTIIECDGANNTHCADVTVDIPDVEVSDDGLVVSAHSDGIAQVSGTITLTNSGCGSTLTADVPVQFTLYDAAGCLGTVLDQWTQTLTGVSIPANGGTQAITISNRKITGNMCALASDCQFSIYVEADISSAIMECDGTNNTYCASPIAVDIPDIEVTADTLAVAPSDDGEVTVSGTVTLANNGCGSNLTTDVPMRFTLYDDAGCAGNVIHSWKETLTAVSIPAGGGTQVFTIADHAIVADLCSDSTNCQVSIHIEADFSNGIMECDGTDNTRCVSPIDVDIPDVHIPTDTLSVSASGDGEVSVSGTVTVYNYGCGSNVTSDIPVRFTLYDNAGCTGSVIDSWTETFDDVNIPVGGSAQVFTITSHAVATNLCDNSTNCQVSIRIEADYSDSIDECDGTDNTYCADNKNVNIPDIYVPDEWLSVAASDDGEITVSGTIPLVNYGCGANLTNDVPMRFMLYDNAGCTGSVLDSWTETFDYVNIPIGGTTQVFTITPRVVATNLCDNSTNCQVSIRIEADYSDATWECDGANNECCVNKGVDIPDLAISDDDLAISCASDGVSISGNVTLINNGCGSSFSSNVQLQLTLYDNVGCTGIVLGEKTVTLMAGDVPAGGGTQEFLILPQAFTCDLCGCEDVSVHMTLDPNDGIFECDDTDNERCSDKTVVDTVDPQILGLRVDEHFVVDDCCEAVVTFDGYVLDDCCVASEDVTFIVTNSTDNATVSFGRADVTFTSIGKYRVDFSGEIRVSCLTSCPAFIEVTVDAFDACGNAADTVVSVPDPAELFYNGGDLYDETPPAPKDDPNGDEGRSASDNLEVRSDGSGQYRLMVRQDTPVRVDVVYNDSDNCSACTCEKHLWVDDIVTPPGHGTATIEDAESSVSDPGTSIRYAPYHGYYGMDAFTYRIVDAYGNVSQEATVYLEVVAQTVMDDIYLTTCVDTAVSFDVTATDLWIDSDNPDEIPFVFSILTPPMHGVVSGDLGAVTYATHGGIESATITLVYTPAAGFAGRDALTLRFADPFGGSSTAVVDIAVIECAGQPGAPPLFVLQQGEIFPLIVPLTFSSVYEKEWNTVTVQAIDATGTLYNEALSAEWEESIGRYVLRLDTASLPPGLYQMTIPLGNGETVMLLIEVSEAV